LNVRSLSSHHDDSSIVQSWSTDRGARSNVYHFVTSWRVRASASEIWELVTNPEDLVRWFPATFLDAERAQPAADLRPGSHLRFHVKGWLPYTLRFEGRIHELDDLRKCSVDVWGDFEGRLDCEFEERGEHCTVRFDWNIRVQKPLVRWLSFPLKALFCSNHLWVMLRGWQSLRVEIADRRAKRLGHLTGRSELKMFR
jgi:hypothetical protein